MKLLCRILGHYGASVWERPFGSLGIQVQRCRRCSAIIDARPTEPTDAFLIGGPCDGSRIKTLAAKVIVPMLGMHRGDAVYERVVEYRYVGEDAATLLARMAPEERA